MTNICETEHEVIIEAAQDAQYAIIWLHGLGADGHDFVPIVNELDFPKKAQTRFVFPHAEVMPVTVNGGMSMRAWYDILQIDLVRRVDGRGILSSVERVAGLLRQQTEKGIPLERIVLAGFSQGGVIALHTAMQLNLQVAGIMALSTYLPMRETLEDGTPAQQIFLAHGVDDGVVPYSEALGSLDWLRSHGHTVTWRNYAMMHSVCAEEVADISEWLTETL
jgi:phospholipase/carboxylesterase